MLGVSEQHFDRAYRVRLGKKDQKKSKDGRRVWFKAEAVVRLKAEAIAKDMKREDELLPLAGDKDLTPEDRRYRKAKAELAELDLAERRGQLVRKDRVKEEMVRLGQMIKTAGEILGRDFGPEAQKVIEDTVRSWAAEVRRMYGGG